MQPAIPLDVAERVIWAHAGVTWSLTYLPFGKDEELRAVFLAAYKPVHDAPEGEKDAASKAHRPALMRAYAEIVRWGVVGWDLPKLPCRKAPVTYAGETYQVLEPGVALLLGKVNHGNLLEELALQVLRVNALTEEDLLGFR
jgi:hypothetical protein